MADLIYINRSEAAYPPALHLYLADDAPVGLAIRGNVSLLRKRPLVALFCSVQCTESIIVQTYELARALGAAGVTVVGGFHAPMEKECLRLLLEGTASVIACPARSLEQLRLSADCRKALIQNRLLFLSSFAEEQRRATTRRAVLRNELVAALADVVLIAHAIPGGKIERLCERALSWGKPVLALENGEHRRLLALGAQRVWIEHIQSGEAFLNY